ncbi:MAG TPA: hypothetical protein PK024_09050 [Methanospirillum sp.]|uniref:hypothetical protein n=1 Tax=Methanospirillum sp. TaxID=45200 RepID=UPI002B75C217|nr:hypothetical protein [Methanospirillum sp.]HOJ96964.1 hypothetical protein [Methanospirillum sp.]HPP78253.1 hypothetical protein [Methanospirillum sp.]
MPEDSFEWVHVSERESNIQLYVIARYLYMWIWGVVGFNISVASIIIILAVLGNYIASVILMIMLLFGIINLIILDKFAHILFQGDLKAFV